MVIKCMEDLTSNEAYQKIKDYCTNNIIHLRVGGSSKKLDEMIVGYEDFEINCKAWIELYSLCCDCIEEMDPDVITVHFYKDCTVNDVVTMISHEIGHSLLGYHFNQKEKNLPIEQDMLYWVEVGAWAFGFEMLRATGIGDLFELSEKYLEFGLKSYNDCHYLTVEEIKNINPYLLHDLLLDRKPITKDMLKLPEIVKKKEESKLLPLDPIETKFSNIVCNMVEEPKETKNRFDVISESNNAYLSKIKEHPKVKGLVNQIGLRVKWYNPKELLNEGLIKSEPSYPYFLKEESVARFIVPAKATISAIINVLTMELL